MAKNTDKKLIKYLYAVLCVQIYLIFTDFLFLTVPFYKKWSQGVIGSIIFGVIYFGFIVVNIYVLVKYFRTSSLLYRSIMISSTIGTLIPIIYGFLETTETYPYSKMLTLYLFPVLSLLLTTVALIEVKNEKKKI